MLSGQKIVVVMPAYNAARTLKRTYNEVMEQGIVDLVIVVDDASNDETVEIARTLEDVQVEVHPKNRGYGGNQKTCYRLALAAGGGLVEKLARPRAPEGFGRKAHRLIFGEGCARDLVVGKRRLDSVSPAGD